MMKKTMSTSREMLKGRMTKMRKKTKMERDVRVAKEAESSTKDKDKKGKGDGDNTGGSNRSKRGEKK